MMNEIKHINADSVHRICSGQVILDLQSAVKELLENALDAGATNIEIRLKDHGFEFFECSDNGHGLEKRDLEKMCEKYATSKMRAFKDLYETVSTFGFRGEALSSLCAISDGLSVHTMVDREDVVGQKFHFDRNGAVESEEVCARSVGTTVRVEKLFHTLAVRRKQFLRNKSKEFAKVIKVMQAYALAQETTQCRFLLTNQPQGKNGSRQIVLQCRSEDRNFRDRVASVFSAKTAEAVFEINFNLKASNEEDLEEEEEEDDYNLGVAKGWVSIPGLDGQKTSARASADRQFFYVNGRPVDYPKIAKTLNEMFRAYNVTTASANYPACAINFEVPKNLVDVNVSPDKRTVLFTNEHDILMFFRNGLKKSFESYIGGGGGGGVKNVVVGDSVGTQRNFKATGVDLSQLPTSTVSKSASMVASALGRVEDGGSDDDSDDINDLPRQLEANAVTAAAAIGTNNSNKPSSAQTDLQAFGFTRERALENTTSTVIVTANDDRVIQRNSMVIERIAAEIRAAEAESEERMNNNEKFQSLPETYKERSILLESDDDDDDDDFDPKMKEVKKKKRKLDVVLGVPSKDDVIVVEEEDDIMDVNDGKDNQTPPQQRNSQEIDNGEQNLKLAFDIEKIRAKRIAREQQRLSLDASKEERASADAELLKEASLHNQDNVAATNALIRRFDKSEFANVEIVGQFNLGFIIVVRDKTDLFIVDQHASDEIYNFERLQKTTILNKQPLIQPQRLDLSPAEEQIARSNEKIFLMNGFGFCDVEDEGEASRQRLALTAVPFSKDTVFDASDVHELVSMLDEGAYAVPARSQLSIGLNSASKSIVRPSKVRGMLAMRACRSSIMIGTPLGKSRMKKILNNLATLEAPWNCPHGRPTMRHGCRL